MQRHFYSYSCLQQIRFLFHLFPARIGIDQSGPLAGMASLICDFRNRISHLQGMRAEVMPERVRGNPIRTLIEKTVHTAAVEFPAIPADKQVFRL